jgi:hypothetical protein
MEKRVHLCRIRLVEVGQKGEQEQCFECEPPRLPSPNDLWSPSKSDINEQAKGTTDRDDGWEQVVPQKVGTRAELINTTEKDDGEL